MGRQRSNGQDRAASIGGSAVVVGASMAGLCAARVLADRFDRVTVLDRDELPDGPVARAQVPQGRHPHLLLAAGAQLLEGWFPGLGAELEAAGAQPVDLCGDTYWYQAGGPARRAASAAVGPAMSRPLLEWVVRRRVAALPNVEIHDRTAVTGLVVTPDRARVTGVRLADGPQIDADLVVDASGRQAHSLGWLADLGYEPPPVSQVHVDTRYVSRTYRRTQSPDRDWKMAGIIDDPAAKRLTMALPLEGDRWIVMFGGVHGEVAPLDEAERLEYASTFPSPAIATLLADAEPLSDVATHRFPANQLRHVAKLRRFPAGWVLLGDAVSSFNPIYGQGMTSAAQQAQALGTCLDRAGAVDHRFARRYFKAASKVVAVPWSIAVGTDFAYPETTGEKPAGTDLLNRYTDRLTIAAQHDDVVSARFNEVVALLRRPESLMSPGMLFRVWRHGGRGPAADAATASPAPAAVRP
jgi:2-polyprenyl-6-methoxyphenol hydroxylase-like FAD-dependent oxidoreductase